MCLKNIFRTQRLVRAVLALDEDGSGLQALGVVPLADGDAEADAVGSGEVGRSPGGSNKAFKQGSVRGVIVLTHRAADEHNGFCRTRVTVNRQDRTRLQSIEHTLAAVLR